GRLRPAVPAPADGPGLRLPGGERRGPAARPVQLPPLAAPHDQRPQAAPRPRHRGLRDAARAEPVGARLPAPGHRRRRRGGHRPLRQQPVPVPAAVRADDGAAGRQGADRADGPGAVPAHRRAALLRHPAGTRVLLVRARRPAAGGGGELSPPQPATSGARRTSTPPASVRRTSRAPSSVHSTIAAPAISAPSSTSVTAV